MAEAKSILLTPRGNHLVPGEPQDCIYVYYPDLPGSVELTTAWIERIRPDESVEHIEITSDRIRYYDPEEELIPEAVNLEEPIANLVPEETSQLIFDEIRSFLVTPQVVNATF